MAAGIIALAGMAAWMGLAHGCEPSRGNGVIAGRVSIDPGLAANVNPTAVLFVIVRRPQGPPRPLAVKRIDGPRFPVSFEITNQDIRSEEHTSELQSQSNLVCRLLLEKKNNSATQERQRSIQLGAPMATPLLP